MQLASARSASHRYSFLQPSGRLELLRPARHCTPVALLRNLEQTQNANEQSNTPSLHVESVVPLVSTREKRRVSDPATFSSRAVVELCFNNSSSVLGTCGVASRRKVCICEAHHRCTRVVSPALPLTLDVLLKRLQVCQEQEPQNSLFPSVVIALFT